MSKTEKKYKLDLTRVLLALDSGDKSFYSNLTVEEKKAYAPLVLMRYMSSLSDQSPHKQYAVLAANDLINIGFWQLSKHPELQHLLLCVAGLGGKQYRPWIATKGRGSSKTSLLDEFFIDLHPGINATELDILKSNYDATSFRQLCVDAGKSDREIKDLAEEWKKYAKNG